MDFTKICTLVLRACICVIAFAGVIIFFIPTTRNILNIGNAFGMVFCACTFTLFAFFDKCLLLISKLWANLGGRIFLSIFGIFLALGIIYGIVASVFMGIAISDKPAEPQNMIVLGCKVNGSTPSLMLTRRLNTAYDYLIENESVLCVVSGGQGSDEDIPEGVAMRNYLVGKGIDSGRIIVEDKSTSTYENIKFSNKLLEDIGEDGKVVIVTDAFHQCRAKLIASKQGVDTDCVSGYTSWWLVPTYWVREWFGLFNEILMRGGF